MKLHIKCPLCKRQHTSYCYGSRDRMLGLSGNFEIWKCDICGIYFLSPQFTENEIFKYYPGKKYYAYKIAKNKNFFQKLRSYLILHYYHPDLMSTLISAVIHGVPAIPESRPEGKVLDIGCGTGETLSLLEELGWDAYGMDMDANALEAARKRGLVKLKKGRYGDLKDYPDNFFDAIRLYHVIEHLNDPEFCLKLIKLKLKRGGEVIIGTPNIHSMVSRVFRTNWYNLDSPRHLILFNPVTLSALINKSGFRLKNIEFCSAGGLLGSIEYMLEEKLHKRINLIHNFWLVMFFYPVEWIMDKLGMGDVFVIRAVKT